MQLPQEIYAGDRLEFIESNSNFPASQGWTCKYVLINQSNKYSLISTPTNDDHSFLIPSSTTGPWTPGIYTSQIYFEFTDGTRDGIERDSILVNPNLIDALLYDTRSHAEKMVEAIDALLEAGIHGETQIHIQSEGEVRSYTFKTLDELRHARNDYRAQVIQEQQTALVKAGNPSGKKILIAFK